MTQSIEERYTLELAPVSMAGKRLEIHRVADLDPLIHSIGSQADGAVGDFPFWVKVWPAAIVLTGHLLNMNLDLETTVLEIGAGMGITGLFLAREGYRVTATDSNEDALELLAMNAGHNGLETLDVRPLDWAATDLGTRFDIVCGSELIYNEAAVAPVIQVLHDHLAPGGTVLMAHDIGRQWLTRFVEAAESDFEVGHRVDRIADERGTHRVLVTKLKRKPKKSP